VCYVGLRGSIDSDVRMRYDNWTPAKCWTGMWVRYRLEMRYNDKSLKNSGFEDGEM
jgi:hypothetical protein